MTTRQKKKRCEDCKHGYIAFIDSDEVVACKKKKAYMARGLIYEACTEYEEYTGGEEDE